MADHPIFENLKDRHPEIFQKPVKEKKDAKAKIVKKLSQTKPA